MRVFCCQLLRVPSYEGYHTTSFVVFGFDRSVGVLSLYHVSLVCVLHTKWRLIISSQVQYKYISCSYRASCQGAEDGYGMQKVDLCFLYRTSGVWVSINTIMSYIPPNPTLSQSLLK